MQNRGQSLYKGQSKTSKEDNPLKKDNLKYIHSQNNPKKRTASPQGQNAGSQVCSLF